MRHPDQEGKSKICACRRAGLTRDKPSSLTNRPIQMNDWIQESCKRQNQYTKARCVPHTNYEPFRKLLRNQVPFIVMWEGTKHLGTHQAPEARDLQADNRGTLPGLPCGLRDSLSCIIFVATKMNERSESNSGSLQGYTHCSVLDSIQTMSSSPHTL